VEDVRLFIFVHEPERTHVHFASIIGRCAVQTTNKRADRVDGTAGCHQIGAGGATRTTLPNRMLFEEGLDPIVFHRGSGRNAEVLTARMATRRTEKIRNQIVKVLKLHACYPFSPVVAGEFLSGQMILFVSSCVNPSFAPYVTTTP
jgi:hypothetical protein